GLFLHGDPRYGQGARGAVLGANPAVLTDFLVDDGVAVDHDLGVKSPVASAEYIFLGYLRAGHDAPAAEDALGHIPRQVRARTFYGVGSRPARLEPRRSDFQAGSDAVQL